MSAGSYSIWMLPIVFFHESKKSFKIMGRQCILCSIYVSADIDTIASNAEVICECNSDHVF